MVREELLMERFRVLERIGSGGMGTVYRAFDERLQRQVAVKEVDTGDPERVVREAQAAARLNHPGIVTLYELGERDGRALLVTELVPGETLAELHSGGGLCDRDVAEIGADLCDALAHAHARGVIHRDVKPQNVIVAIDQGLGRHAKLMDFGIARIAGAPTLSATGEVVGTLAYMSPEQAEGGLAGPESDVYSLALTLYECWAGFNPVAGDTPAQTARRIGGHVPSLAIERRGLPDALVGTIDACLDPDPGLRPTALELRACLEHEIRALDPRRPVPVPEPGPDFEPEPRPRLGTGRLATLVGIVAALVALAGPVGAGGLALVLAVLFVPALVLGLRLSGLVPLAAPLLAAVSAGGAAAALGGPGATPLARAILGLSAWSWLLAGSLALGIGPDLGIANPAPDGWATDPAIAADAVLAPLFALESLLGMAVFAAAGVAIGWLLGARHVSLALLAAMLWAAGVDAALSIVGDGGLSGNPLAVVVAAAIAVAIEFGLVRGAVAAPRARRAPPPAPGLAPLHTRI